LLSAVLVLAIAIVGCATGHSKDAVLARVNDEPVTVQDLEEGFTGSHQGHGALLAGQGAVRKFLEKVIDKQLLLQEARRIGLDQDPEIEKAMTELAAKRAAEGLYQDEVKSTVEISEEEIVAAHERMGYRFQARRILVENREAAEKALVRFHAGEDFGEVALQVSRGPAAQKGGYLGIVRWGQLDPGLEEVLWSLETGQVSKPFKTEEGWNLVYVVDKVTLEPPPELDKVKPSIRAILTKRKARQRADDLFRDLTVRWKARIHEKALVEVVQARDVREPPPDLVLAEAAGEKITLDKFLHRVDMDKVRKLPDTMALRAMRYLLEDEIFWILVRKEGLARGYGERPEVVREIERLRDDRAMNLLLSKVVYAKLEVSDEEAEGYYRDHPEEFTEPEAVKVSIILLETEEEARGVMAQLQNGQDFAALARKASKHGASAALGGEAGWVRKGKTDADIEKVMFSLQVGEVGLVTTANGTVVFQVEEKKESRRRSFDEVREHARRRVLRQKSRQTLKEWVTRLREASVIEIDDEAINRAVVSYEEAFREKATATQ
jgi:parvulin-like peptidyl-prolyl isomerase